MRRIIYYVAVSLDGFISGPDGDISGYAGEGNGVEKYKKDLLSYDTVIMGRKTYEFGYRFGLVPGQPVYPHMVHYIFSDSLILNEMAQNVFVKKIRLEEIEKIRNLVGSDIYLCGGGQLAGWLLDNRQIEILKVKLNPLLTGQGIRIFGNSKQKLKLDLIDSGSYDNGLQILTYKINY